MNATAAGLVRKSTTVAMAFFEKKGQTNVP